MTLATAIGRVLPIPMRHLARYKHPLLDARFSNHRRTMLAVRVNISRYVDESFPGWVECSLVDAYGYDHVFVEKVPVVTRPIWIRQAAILDLEPSLASSKDWYRRHPDGSMSDYNPTPEEIVDKATAPGRIIYL